MEATIGLGNPILIKYTSTAWMYTRDCFCPIQRRVLPRISESAGVGFEVDEIPTQVNEVVSWSCRVRSPASRDYNGVDDISVGIFDVDLKMVDG